MKKTANRPEVRMEKVIRESEKSLKVQIIPLNKDVVHRPYLSGGVDIVYRHDFEKACVEVVLNPSKMSSFKFKLFCKDFMNAPCYRFDSDGRSHVNRTDDTHTLPQRIVSTPHYHRFNEAGVEIAYKTNDMLRDEKSYWMDYKGAFIKFCNEELISLTKAPTFFTGELEGFGESESLEDPLKGVEFP